MATRVSFITPNIVREFLDYFPQSGKLRWRKRDRKWFDSDRICNSWNSKYAGKKAFDCLDSHGYKCGRIFKIKITAHRVAFMHYHGYLPAIIDHENRNRADNRIHNLRAASRALNARNRSIQSNNTTGHTGVYRINGRWTAKVQIGTFKTKQEAIEALERAKEAFLQTNE